MRIIASLISQKTVSPAILDLKKFECALVDDFL